MDLLFPRRDTKDLPSINASHNHGNIPSAITIPMPSLDAPRKRSLLETRAHDITDDYGTDTVNGNTRHLPSINASHNHGNIPSAITIPMPSRPGDIPGIMEYSGIDKGMTRYQRESFRNYS
jgi:hypothetical protein